jgi:hypothetical protein
MYKRKRRGSLAHPRYLVRGTKRKRSSKFKSIRKRGYKESKYNHYNQRSGGFIGVERKYNQSWLRNSLVASTVDCTGGELDPIHDTGTGADPQGHLTPIDRGSAVTERNGNRVIITDLHIQGFVSLSSETGKSGANPGMQNFRIAVVLDTQTNGAQLSSEDVYENIMGADVNVTVLDSLMYMRNREYTNRFKVLKEIKINPQSRIPVQVLDNVAQDSATTAAGAVTKTFTYSSVMVPFELHLNKLSIPITFLGSSTDGKVAQVTDNSLHVVGFSDNGAQCIIDYVCRYNFSDQ